MPCLSYVCVVCFCAVSFSCFQETIEDEVGRVCGMHRGEDICVQDFGGET